jgi:hypothetical protein
VPDFVSRLIGRLLRFFRRLRHRRGMAGSIPRSPEEWDKAFADLAWESFSYEPGSSDAMPASAPAFPSIEPSGGSTLHRRGSNERASGRATAGARRKSGAASPTIETLPEACASDTSPARGPQMGKAGEAKAEKPRSPIVKRGTGGRVLFRFVPARGGPASEASPPEAKASLEPLAAHVGPRPSIRPSLAPLDGELAVHGGAKVSRSAEDLIRPSEGSGVGSSIVRRLNGSAFGAGACSFDSPAADRGGGMMLPEGQIWPGLEERVAAADDERWPALSPLDLFIEELCETGRSDRQGHSPIRGGAPWSE